MARSRSVSELSRSIAASRGSILAVFVFSVVANLLILTGPLFMLQVYDRVLASRSEETLVALFTLVAALWLFFGVLDYARVRIMARIGARLQTAMGARVLRAMAEQSPRQHRGTNERGNTGDLETLRVSLS